MFNINKYLERFSKNISSTEIQKKQISEIVEKHTHINILLEDVEIKNYILYIKSSPGVKNKIFIYKEKILEEISSLISSIKIIDIR